MKKLLGICAFVALLVAPGVASAQSSTGSHAYDWLIGTWSCTNATPNAMAGPASQTETVTRSSTTGAFITHFTGTNFDQYGFLSYDPATRTWWSSWAFTGGSIGNESTTMSGAKTVWHGSFFNAANGTHSHLRDTMTISSPTKYTDLGEDDSSGSMKPIYNGTCTKS